MLMNITKTTNYKGHVGSGLPTCLCVWIVTGNQRLFPEQLQGCGFLKCAEATTIIHVGKLLA